MRATDLHRFALQLRRIRAVDLLAAVVIGCGAITLYVLVMMGAISLVDWIEGRPHTVIPAIVAFLQTADGVRP